MNAENILTVAAAVVGLVQLVKWAGIRDTYGPIAVLFFSLLGVALWGWSVGTFERTQAFDYFAAWIGVATSAAGVFGFTRASVGAVSRMTPPPDSGAGSKSHR